MSKIKIIALMGKAGAGKDYLLQELLKTNNYNEIISCTTRSPRENEVDGKNYYFMKEEEFFKSVKNNEMLEFACFNGWFYGTPLKSLSQDKINIGVFNPDGIRQLLKNTNLQVDVHYVRALDKTRLLRQLNREEDPDVNEIIRRWQTDEKDFYNLDFPYIEHWNDTFRTKKDN